MPSKAELAIDIVQFALDIVGIVDPTGVADGMSGLMSLGRGRWLDAAISGASMIPYIGDLAKTAKLPRYVKSIKQAIAIAAKDYRFAAELRPALTNVKTALDKVPMAKLPGKAQVGLTKIKKEIDQFLSRRFYHPNPKHEVAGAGGRRGTKLDLTSDQAYQLLNDPLRSVAVQGKKQVVAVKDGKVYVFQPDGAGSFHGYPSSGKEVAAKYPTAASHIARMLGVNVKRLSRMD